MKITFTATMTKAEIQSVVSMQARVEKLMHELKGSDKPLVDAKLFAERITFKYKTSFSNLKFFAGWGDNAQVDFTIEFDEQYLSMFTELGAELFETMAPPMYAMFTMMNKIGKDDSRASQLINEIQAGLKPTEVEYKKEKGEEVHYVQS